MVGRVKFIITDDTGMPITGTRGTAILPALTWSATRVVNGEGVFTMSRPKKPIDYVITLRLNSAHRRKLGENLQIQYQQWFVYRFSMEVDVLLGKKNRWVC